MKDKIIEELMLNIISSGLGYTREQEDYIKNSAYVILSGYEISKKRN